jgi:uncharacterized protein YkwD
MQVDPVSNGTRVGGLAMDRADAGEHRIAIIALLLLVVLLAQGLAANHASASSRPDQRRSKMLSLTNHDRAERDESSLALNAALSRFAERHSGRMAAKGYLFHSTDLAAKLKGLDWTIGGENVGVGPTLGGLESAFMKSTPHRKNILRRAYDHVAIGVVRANGSFWVTVIFYG